MDCSKIRTSAGQASGKLSEVLVKIVPPKCSARQPDKADGRLPELRTASTGTAISTLSGVAATNTTLAALGGGSLAAGGGGVSLGSTVSGAATLGVGLLVGGAILSFTGSSLVSKADEVWKQMCENEYRIDTICDYMERLQRTSGDYLNTLNNLEEMYESDGASAQRG